METRTVEQVESWKSRPFTDGYPGLRELSDGEFSGAVRAGGAWLFMLNGRVIGVHEGSLDDFEDADGTAYAAPHPSLPLLFSMKAEGGETRAKYYTNDTPLSEADSTLTDGGFTGYVELSENVLSGDYYVAYYGGRSMSVAFVGASEQVISGDEAFERAADEVGIYEVRDVDLEVIDLPEPEEPDDAEESADPAPAGSAAGTDASGATGSADSSATGTPAETDDQSADRTGRSAADETPDAAGSEPTPGVTEAEPSKTEPSRTESTDSRPTGAETSAADSAADAATDSATTDPAATGESNRSAPDAGTDASAGAGTDADADSRAPGSTRQSPTATAETVTEPPKDATVTEEETATETATTAEAVAEADPAPERADSAGEQATDDEGMFDDEEEWREATTIPSLDPDRTEDSEPDGSRKGEQASASTSAPASASADRTDRTDHTKGQSKPSPDRSGRSSSKSTPRSKAAAQSESRDRATEASTPDESSSETAADEANAKIEQLRSKLERRGQRVEQLEDRLSKVQSERDELKRERDALRQEVERLEAELESAANAGNAAGGGAGRRLDRAQAFDGTNLFVRYRSKGDATLDEAAAGDADPEDVNANLQLEHHTQFEADDVAVEGAPFADFLADSFEYRFASWVVEDLLYEIRDTGHRGRLRDLYDAIPKIDRVDLHGSVSAGADDEDTRQEAFDVIMRDRMGNPLLVADLNGSRDPTTGEMMGSLVDAATGVGQAHDELAGAFQVTESFFEPEALETTESATSGGLLSREKRESFVKLSRKRGYHLCLVESRSGGFHLNVPEL